MTACKLALEIQAALWGYDMTQTIAENENRDMFKGDDGNIAFFTGINCTAQLCKSRVESQRGEMIYAKDQGMPTRATAWDQFNPKAFQAAARTIMVNTPDVTQVTSFAMQKVNNDLQYQATIQTDDGNTAVITGVSNLS